MTKNDLKEVKIDKWIIMDVRQGAIQFFLDKYAKDEYHHVRAIIESFLTLTASRGYTVVGGKVYEQGENGQKTK